MISAVSFSEWHDSGTEIGRHLNSKMLNGKSRDFSTPALLDSSALNHAVSRFHNSMSSSFCLMALVNFAPSAPSTMRWSHESVN